MFKLPWKETLFILLILALEISLSDLRLKSQYAQEIARHPGIRFVILFSMAFLLFSLDIDGKYSIITRVIVAAIVATIVQSFIASNMVLMSLRPV